MIRLKIDEVTVACSSPMLFKKLYIGSAKKIKYINRSKVANETSMYPTKNIR